MKLLWLRVQLVGGALSRNIISPEFVDAVKLLCDKGYPNLEEKARECLALNHYLSQIDNRQVAFSDARVSSKH